MASLPPPSFTISSDTFLIRPMVRGDASPALEAWIEDENAAAMLNTQRRSWTLAQQAEYFGKHEGRPDRHILGIFPKQSKEPIGLFIVKVKPKDGVFTISHLIGDQAWRGKDTTFSAAELVYDYFFNVLGYAKAKANVRPENKPMLWLLYNYVWRKEARLIKHLRLAATKERSDLIVFGMLAEEWRAWHEDDRRKAESGDDIAGRVQRS
jgi:RimJ/RimL family protein N-acetyltransferase